jgi:membrane protein DedA with SNARE-associated domain
MFDSLLQTVSSSPWTYALILGVCASDAVFPLFPSETVVVAAAVLAANGGLSIAIVAAAAAVGALLGDNAAYLLGQSGLRRLADRLLASGRNRERIEWARVHLRRHGTPIIIVARFIPGGRTATTYASGTLGLPWKRRFLPADGVAAALWAIYASALGYFGGAAFRHNLWLPLLVAAGVGLLVGGGGELARRTLLARGRDRHGRGSRRTPDRRG